MTCKCKMVTITKRKKRSCGIDNSSLDPINSIWRGIRYRCKTGTNYSQKKYYLDRGIKISVEWSESFHVFKLDMGERPSPSHSVERVDNSRGYCKHNCKWATPYEQALNRRNTVKDKSWPLGMYKNVNRGWVYRRNDIFLGRYSREKSCLKAAKFFQELETKNTFKKSVKLFKKNFFLKVGNL